MNCVLTSIHWYFNENLGRQTDTLCRCSFVHTYNNSSTTHLAVACITKICDICHCMYKMNPGITEHVILLPSE